MTSTSHGKIPAHKAPRSYQQILDEVTHTEEALDVVFVAKKNVACTGPGAALGHPIVYYTIDDKGYAECKYCDRVFVYDPERAGN